MLALIDGDLLLYRIGFTTQSDPEWVAAARCDEMLDNILVNTGAKEFRVFLSDSKENNFRFKLHPFYKANRKQEKPTHYEFLKEHLIVRWGAEIAHGQEADDALGIAQTNSGTSVICSIDKDLLMIPGNHFNFVKGEWQQIREEEGIKRFYAQMLTGDTSDNIRGCRGIGPVKAAKALDGLTEPEDLFSKVFELYLQQEEEMSSEDILQHLLTIGRLLKIRQKENETWHFPQSPVIAECFA